LTLDTLYHIIGDHQSKRTQINEPQTARFFLFATVVKTWC
jgi:hypothetical protein